MQNLRKKYEAQHWKELKNSTFYFYLMKKIFKLLNKDHPRTNQVKEKIRIFSLYEFFYLLMFKQKKTSKVIFFAGFKRKRIYQSYPFKKAKIIALKLPGDF